MCVCSSNSQFTASKHSGRAPPSTSTVVHVLQFPAQTISSQPIFDTTQLAPSPHFFFFFFRFPILLLATAALKRGDKMDMGRGCARLKCCRPKSLRGAKCLSPGKKRRHRRGHLLSNPQPPLTECHFQILKTIYGFFGDKS